MVCRQFRVILGLLVFGMWLKSSAPLHGQVPALQPYLCLTKQYDTDKWLKEGARSFDRRGILQQALNYHGLAIAFLGIMRYEDFLATGDSVYYWQVVDQYKYFSDTSLVMITDGGKGMAMPYRVTFKDMQGPWISGMAQGAGLSYLARYYALTGDTTALRTIRQVAYVLLKPVEQGGTIGKTPEGYPWIEEYPGSKAAPEVLNGFINGLIGLHEYNRVLPGDTAAIRMEKTCYRSFLETISAYDTPTWTDYKRIRNSIIQLSYLRYQLAELEHLYEIYGDDFLLRQSQIWSMMTYQSIDSSQKSYRTPLFEFAKAILDTPSGKWIAGDSLFCTALRSVQGGKEMLGNAAARFPAVPLALKDLHKQTFQFAEPIYFLRLRFSDSRANSKISCEATDATGKDIGLRLAWRGEELWVYSPQPIHKLHLRPIGKPKDDVFLKEALVLDKNQQKLPIYGFYEIREQQEMQESKAYKIMLEMENINEAKLFYRTESNELRFRLATWNKENYIDLPASEFKPPSSGIYEFFISFPITQPSPRIHRFELVDE